MAKQKIKKKKPTQFRNLSEAIAKLERQSGLTLGRIPGVKDGDSEKLIEVTIGANIFRVFSGTPSQVFRHWAKDNYELLVEGLRRVKNQQAYDEIVNSYTVSLASYWQLERNEKIGYGPCSKMVNLFIKAIYRQGIVNNQRIEKFFHVPLDSFSILPLRNIIDELNENELFGIPITTTATMNFVVNRQLYDEFQRVIKLLCRRAGITPYQYEIWAWDKHH